VRPCLRRGRAAARLTGRNGSASAAPPSNDLHRLLPLPLLSFPREVWTLAGALRRVHSNVIPRLHEESYTKHTSCNLRAGLITVYIANVHVLRVFQVCFMCAPCMPPRVNGILLNWTELNWHSLVFLTNWLMDKQDELIVIKWSVREHSHRSHVGHRRR